MSSSVNKRGFGALVLGFILFIVFLFLTVSNDFSDWIAGYTVGLLATVLHFVQLYYFKKLENKRFFTLYGPLTLLRIALVLLLFTGLLIWEKFDQFSFTVSFLISYIYNSVIDIYLINND